MLLPPRTIVLFLTCTIGALYAETFSSVSQLRALKSSNQELIQEIKEYIRMEEVRIKYTKSAMEELEKVTRSSGNLSHPIDAFSSVRAWYQVTKRLSNATSNHEYLQSRIKKTKLPLLRKRDYLGSIASLLRLQATYNLNSSDLVIGNIHHGDQVYTSQPLDADSVCDIGRRANRLKLYDQAVDWLTLCFSMVTKLSIQVIIDLADSYTHIGETDTALMSAKQIENIGADKRWKDMLMTSLPENSPSGESGHARGQGDRPKGEDDRPKGEEGRRKGKGYPPWGEFERQTLQKYLQLCRGDTSTMNQYLWREQRCVYQYYMVGGYVRYKAEIHSEDPWIVFYHDILSDSESQEIIKLSIPELKRSREGGRGSASTPYRTAKIAWLGEDDGLISSVTQRVSMVTGLNTNTVDNLFESSAEELQTVNYGIGGQYDPHYDCRSDDEEGFDFPERIGTFLFYLNDVAAGGATVFTHIGVSVTPVKNGALFWYNKRRGGQTDDNTLHAGCPVLIGEKWIANKWILDYNNHFHRRCGLNMDEPQYDPNRDRNKIFIV